MTFDKLGLHESVLRAVAEAGYTEPTPIQAAAIPIVLSGVDVIGIAQTGTGKTAAFTLPLLTRLAKGKAERGAVRALILAPTRELVVQIEQNVRAYSRHLPLAVAIVYGGVGERSQISALRAGCDLLVATPGRLLDLASQGHGDFRDCEVLVLDEADRMLDMGFLPSIRRIVRGLPKDRQTLMFSATLSKEIEQLTSEFQKSPKFVEVSRRSNPAELVEQTLYECPHNLKQAMLTHLLAQPGWDTVLVFSRTKHGADRICRKLAAAGVESMAIHANRSQSQRQRALESFKSGQVRVLVATDIASRGIDVDGITHVVNFDFPDQLEDYVHRIGRTGRAGATGKAVTFITSEDRGDLRRLERMVGKALPPLQRPEGFNFEEATRQAFSQKSEDTAPRQRHMRGPGHGRREAEQKARPPERKPGQWHGGRPQGGGSSGGSGGGGFLARRSAGRGRS
jgi:ATP-dependent RNA helicase RhlE